jgi:RNA polymerase sigma-70 factor (ECF subfamily)
MSAIATSTNKLPPHSGRRTSGETATSSKAPLSLRADNPEDYNALERPQEPTSKRFVDWYREYQSLVKSIVQKTFTNPSKAEEVCSDVWMKVMKAEPNYDPDRSQETTFITMIARSHVIDTLRRDRVRATVRGTEFESDLADNRAPPQGQRLYSQEQTRQVLGQIAKLPELQRDVIHMSYLRGMTLSDVASTLGIPLGTVKSALSRALTKLRDGNLPEAA